MTISELVAGDPMPEGMTPQLGQIPVRGLDYDSRRVAAGYLFFAFPGAACRWPRVLALKAAWKRWSAIAVVSELLGSGRF